MATQSDIIQQLLKLNQKEQLGKGFSITEDPRNTGILSSNDVRNSDSVLTTGFIVDTAPVAHAYKVILAGNREPMLCCSLQTGGGHSTLSADSSFYAPGTSVLVAVNHTSMYGVILGAIPLAGDGKDFIHYTKTSSASRNTPDDSDFACMKLATEKNPYVGIYNFSKGLPIDTTDIGEFGHTTATGVRLMLNPFIALLAVDEYSGLWLFDEDSLVRLSGLNLQLRSSGRENEYLNDEGEYLEYEGSTTYPWEQLGYTKVPTEDVIDIPEEEQEEDWKAFAEPKQEKAKPYHRIENFGGWLGQGKFTQITSPDESKEWNVFEESENLPGLIRETQAIDGNASSLTSNNLFINKRGLIPSISRITRPDDTSTKIGDNSQNYKKTNQFNIEPEVKSSGKPMESVMGLQDSIAYQQNFKELFPFLQHAKDYYVPEDSKLNEGLSRFPDYSKLQTENLISVEGEKEVKILQGSDDIKDRKITVNASESGAANLKDGSVVTFGGCGEEVRMSGGSIFMDAPGDIWLKSGRKIILWAGNDIEIRAKGHIDVSTTEGSVRIKAENQLSMLGGNNKKGGVIIESKSSSDEYDFSKPGEDAQFSGIILKSTGTIATMGSTLYMRSGVNDTGKGIFIDANEGEHSIYTLGKNNINYVENDYVIDYTNLTTGEVNATTKFSKDRNDISGSIIVTGSGTFTERVNCGESYYAVNHIFTGDSASYNKEVPEIEKDKLRDDIEEQSDIVKVENPESEQKTYNSKIEEPIYEEKKIGNEDTIKGAEFTFRNDYELPNDFAVYQSRWQNIGENAGKGGTPWEEKGVVATTVEETYPFPGKDYYTSIPCYVTQAWTLTDYDTGLYKDRWSDDDATEDYKNPVYGEQQKKVLNEYPVIG